MSDFLRSEKRSGRASSRVPPERVAKTEAMLPSALDALGFLAGVGEVKGGVDGEGLGVSRNGRRRRADVTSVRRESEFAASLGAAARALDNIVC